MATSEPVLLTVLIETAALRWSVAGIDLSGNPLPLVQSEAGNLSPYVGQPIDEQVNFLRHRLAGVLQRGCDRLWGRQKKPRWIVFVADGPFTAAPPELTARVAEHFVAWMLNPPVVFFISANSFEPARQLTLTPLAGELGDADHRALETGLARLFGLLGDGSVWEYLPEKTRSGANL